MQKNALSLYELTSQIRGSLEAQFPDSVWVVGEVSEMRTARNGHCYLELIEKDDAKITTKIRATIWAFTYRMLKPYFETTTGQSFSDGLKIMVQVSVEYHELYGLSLNIKDIDPTYTLGDMAKRRLEIIKKLEDEGVLDMNKELLFPEIPQKIAVISSPTAAGYGDFINQLENNPFGYKFYYKLFPAAMQGDETEKSVTAALEKIYQYEDFFDVVVIIRGGGSKAELSSFDSYWMSYNIAQFPLPVLTGIGHERDQSIADMVAFQSLKTPTAVAEFLINSLGEAENNLDDMRNEFVESVKFILAEQKTKIDSISIRFFPFIKQKLTHYEMKLEAQKNRCISSSKASLSNRQNKLDFTPLRLRNFRNQIHQQKETELSMIKSRLKNSLTQKISFYKHSLEKAENFCTHNNPETILEKGYTISTVKGNVIRSKKDVHINDEITTRFKDGKVTSKVTKN